MADIEATGTLPVRDSEGVASLAALVLEQEATRQGAQRSRDPEASADDQPRLLERLQGSESQSLGSVVRRVGVGTLALLAALPFMDGMQGAAFGVLAPDIKASLGLSLAEIGVIGALGGLVVFAAAIPLGSLGDRLPRFKLIGLCTILLGVFTALSGAAQSGWQLVLTSLGAGIGKANEGPVQGSVLADAVPIEGRNRIFGVVRGAQTLSFILGPLAVGLIARLAGGSNGWRLPFFVLAVPTVVLGVVALGTPEPRRGGQEMVALLGEELVFDRDEVAPSLAAAFSRLRKIQTYKYVVLAVSVLGLSLVSMPIYLGLYLHDHFGLDEAGRGLVGALGGLGGLLGVAVAAPKADRLFVRSPRAATQLAGILVVGAGAAQAAAMLMPNVALLTVLMAASGGATFGAFATIQGSMAAVIPYRLRATGSALLFLYLSLYGGLFGALTVSQLSRVVPLRVAMLLVSLVAGVAGGALLWYGARFVVSDMELAAGDLLEERDAVARRASGQTAPLLQVRNVDLSYGPVQVLFDVSLDVWQGEVLALLGTNGAGKSTVLRAITGLSPVDRGVVRMDGKTLTYADPASRLREGIVLVPGGKATFPALTVRENLQARGYSLGRSGADAAIDDALDLFPVLRQRAHQPAGTLSGGEQQMLAIAGALLLKPRLLVIDELSLGLAPVMVQQLLDVITLLKQEGHTMVLVEQSINVALSIADRAIFMEKGQVRFEGPAAELLERDDLVRAVFLGGEGG